MLILPGLTSRFLGKGNDQIIDILLDVSKEVETTPVQAWFGPILMVILTEPQDIKIILTNEHSLNKPYFYDHFHCKTSIIATNKETWKPHRRALNTTFNISMLLSYIPILNDKSRILLHEMDAHVKEPGDLYRTIFIGMIDMVRFLLLIRLNLWVTLLIF